MIRVGVILRIKAAAHVFRHLDTKHHRIWRVTTHFGWNLKRIFCQCGKEWTKPQPGDASPAQLLGYRRQLMEGKPIKPIPPPRRAF